MKIEPRVSIVTLNWNGLGDTIECLESLRRVDYGNFETIVVDNGSRGGQGKKLKGLFPEITLIQNKKNEGFCAANNQGMRQAIEGQADYVLLLNNDTVVKKDFLKFLVGCMEKEGRVWACSPSILHYKSALLGITAMVDKGKALSKSSFRKLDFLTGCCMLIRKKAVEKIGFLDEDYFAYFEDLDYCHRIKEQNHEIKIVKESIVWHKKSASPGKAGSGEVSKSQAVLLSRNRVLFFKKHLTGFQKMAAFSTVLVGYIALIALNPKNIKVLPWYLKGLKQGFGKTTKF